MIIDRMRHQVGEGEHVPWFGAQLVFRPVTEPRYHRPKRVYRIVIIVASELLDATDSFCKTILSST